MGCGVGRTVLEMLCGRREVGDIFQSDSSVVELIEAGLLYLLSLLNIWTGMYICSILVVLGVNMRLVCFRNFCIFIDLPHIRRHPCRRLP